MTANELLELIPEAIKDKYEMFASAGEESLIVKTELGFFSMQLFGECEVSDEKNTIRIKTPHLSVNLFKEGFYFTLVDLTEKPIIKK